MAAKLSTTIAQESTVVFHRKAVERVIRTASQNLDTPMTMGDLARIANLSPFHFNRVFHKITGLPPTQFLYAMRLEKAKRLLLTTELSITNVCFDVGYKSLGTFTSRFSELVGCSPGEYRRLADRVRNIEWEKLFKRGTIASYDPCAKPSINGVIESPDNFEGLIFVGMFEQMIPQNQPVAGTMLTRGGKFQLGPCPSGRYFLLSAALPRCKDPLNYLLPSLSDLLVGCSEGPILVEDMAKPINIKLNLRRLEVIDAPILVSLPSLLLSGVSKMDPGDRSK